MTLLFCLLLVVVFFIFFPVRFIVVVFVVFICFVRDFSIMATYLTCQLPALLFVCVLFVLFLLFVVVLFGEPGQNQGRGLVDRNQVEAPSNFIAGRPVLVI